MFLDANVLFSAAYRPASPLNELFSIPGLRLLTSHLAEREAAVNLLAHKPDALTRSETLVGGLELVAEAGAETRLPDDVVLPENDTRILAAAVAAGATHLLTGDRRHFGNLYGRQVRGVLVLTPAEYLRGRRPL